MPYTPKPPPRTKPEFQDLYDYIEQELQSISRELLETGQLELRTTNSEPIRPREGMIAQADGTNWDPGEGAGTYKYEAGNWVKFGDASHVHTLVDITDAGALAALDQADVANIGPIATDRILGRDTAGSGDAEELTLSQVLDFVGSAARGDILVRGASTWTRLAKGTANTYLKSDGTDPTWAALAARAPDIILEEQQTSGTDGGTFTSGADRVRVLNTEVRDVNNICTLSSNQFTLPAGTYYIEWSAPAEVVANHQSMLYSVTASAVIQRGRSCFASTGAVVTNYSDGGAIVTPAVSTTYEIRHRCQTTRTTNGFGSGAGFGTEIYTRVRIWTL